MLYTFSWNGAKILHQLPTIIGSKELSQISFQFFEGISSSFDLLQAQNQLYTQQQNYVQSMLEVIAKKAALETALNIPIK